MSLPCALDHRRHSTSAGRKVCCLLPAPAAAAVVGMVAAGCIVVAAMEGPAVSGTLGAAVCHSENPVYPEEEEIC